MEVEHEELLDPVSPSGQYLRPYISLSIIAVMESEIAIDDSMAIPLLNDVFLPINPRFSSIMTTGKNREKKCKRVEVNLKEHVKVPRFPQGMSQDYYDDCLSQYLSNLGMNQLPPDRPLWEIHILKYPSRNAAADVIFKLHHALGDGYSLIGALLSCLQRWDNPYLPLTFPSRQSNTKFNNASTSFNATTLKLLLDLFSRVFNTI